MKVICSAHPTYQGKTEPNNVCLCCNAMWNLANHERGYSTLFAYDDHSTMIIVPEHEVNNYETVEFELEHDLLFDALLLAHEQDITFNEFISNTLREFLDKNEKSFANALYENGFKPVTGERLVLPEGK